MSGLIGHVSVVIHNTREQILGQLLLISTSGKVAGIQGGKVSAEEWEEFWEATTGFIIANEQGTRQLSVSNLGDRWNLQEPF